MAKNLSAKLSLDIDEFIARAKKARDEGQAIIDEFSRGIDLQIEASGLDQISSDLQNAADDIAIEVDADTSQAESKLSDLSSEEFKASLGIDTGNADSKVKGVVSETKKIEDKRKVNLDTADAEKKIGGLGESLSGAFDGFDLGSVLNIGGGFAIADLATAGIGALASGFSDAVASGNEFNSALGDLQAKTGATTEEMVKLREASLDAFRAGVGESVAEATAVIGELETRLGTAFTTDEIGQFAGQAQALANLFDKDVNEVIRLSEPLIKQFGLSAEEAFDTLALSLQNGSSAQDDVLDSLSEYSQLAKEAGFSALEFGDALTRGSEAGLFNTDKIADSLKEAQIRINAGDYTDAFKEIITGSGDASDALAQNTQAILDQAAAGEISIKEALQLTSQGISEALDSGQITEAFAATLQTAVAGTPAEDLGVDIYSRIFSAPFDEAEIQARAQEAGESISGAIGQYTTFDEIARNTEAFIADIGQGFITFADTYIAPIVGRAIEFFEGIGEALSGVFDDVDTSGVTGALDTIAGAIGFVVDLVEGTLSNAVSFVGSIIGDVFSGISDVISPIVDAINEVIESFDTGGDTFGQFGEIAGLVTDILSELVGILIDGVVFAARSVTTVIGEVISFFFSFKGSADEATGASEGLSGAVEFLKEVLDGVKNTANGVKNAFSAIVDTIGDVVEAISSGNFAAVIDLISDAPSKVSKSFNEGFTEAERKAQAFATGTASYLASLDSSFSRLQGSLSSLGNVNIDTKQGQEQLANLRSSIEKEIAGVQKVLDTAEANDFLTEEQVLEQTNRLRDLKSQYETVIAGMKKVDTTVSVSSIDTTEFDKSIKDLRKLTAGLDEYIIDAEEKRQERIEAIYGEGTERLVELNQERIAEIEQSIADTLGSLADTTGKALTEGLVGKYDEAYNLILSRLAEQEELEKSIAFSKVEELKKAADDEVKLAREKNEAKLNDLRKAQAKELLEFKENNSEKEGFASQFAALRKAAEEEFEKERLQIVQLSQAEEAVIRDDYAKRQQKAEEGYQKEVLAIEKRFAGLRGKAFDDVLKQQNELFDGAVKKAQEARDASQALFDSFNADSLIEEIERSSEAFDKANDDYQSLSEEQQNLLLSGAIDYNEYVDAVIDAEARKNEELEKLRGQDSESLASSLARYAKYARDVMNVADELLPVFETYFAELDELREKDKAAQEKVSESEQKLREAKEAGIEDTTQLEIQLGEDLDKAKETSAAVDEKLKQESAKGYETELAIAQQTAGALKSLFEENTAAYKAFAITESLIATYLGATKAYEAGPILGPILSGIILAQGLANVAKIAGFEEGGEVPEQKGGFTGNKGKKEVAGVVHGGEFVMTKELTDKHRDLFEWIHKDKDPMEFLIKDNPAYEAMFELKTMLDSYNIGNDIQPLVELKSDLDKQGLTLNDFKMPALDRAAFTIPTPNIDPINVGASPKDVRVLTDQTVQMEIKGIEYDGAKAIYHADKKKLRKIRRF